MSWSESVADVSNAAAAARTTTSQRRDHPGTGTAAVLSTVVPAVLSAAVRLPFLGRTPLFRDEAATLSTAGRPLTELFDLLDTIDLVHAP